MGKESQVGRYFYGGAERGAGVLTSDVIKEKLILSKLKII